MNLWAGSGLIYLYAGNVFMGWQRTSITGDSADSLSPLSALDSSDSRYVEGQLFLNEELAKFLIYDELIAGVKASNVQSQVTQRALQ